MSRRMQRLRGRWREQQQKAARLDAAIEVTPQPDPGGRPVQVRLEGETVWLSQAQMAGLFDVQKAAISKHLKNIFASGELEQAATVSKMETVQKEGGRTVSRQVEHYNLDAIISVGYRVNSTRATRFRQWATGVLREHLVEGYTLNQQRLRERAIEFEQALELLSRTLANRQRVNIQDEVVLGISPKPPAVGVCHRAMTS